MGPVKIRPAVPRDKVPVLEFCRNTWPGGDYIPEVWDAWINDSKSRLVVADIAGKPVGIAHCYFQTREVAWLEGVRVHPSFRGQGIAGRLNLALTQFAETKGAKVARLCTGSKNRASRNHLDKIGFTVLTTFQRLDATKALKTAPRGIWQPRKYDPKFWRWARDRPVDSFKQMYSDGWTWYPISSDTFRRFFRWRGVLLSGSRPWTSCSLFTVEDDRLTWGFAAGPAGEIGDHARYLRHVMPRKKGGKVRALAPVKSQFVKSIEDEGYEKSGKILVYEKRLAGP
jgi:GNAT superfamily N-acetyltransferase